MGKSQNHTVQRVLLLMLSLSLAMPNPAQAKESEARSRIQIPQGYVSLANAGYPIDIILAINWLEQEMGDTGLKIKSLSRAKLHLTEVGYSEPFFIWWPGTQPTGHPNGSLWLLSRYIQEASDLLKKRFDVLVEAVKYSKYSLRGLDEAFASVDIVSNAEASIQGQIFLEDRALKEKYGKLAREIGAKPPWEMLTETAIRDAMKAKR